MRTVAEQCKYGECVTGLPVAFYQPAEKDDPNESQSSRKLLYSDNALGSNKATWITSLAQKLGTEKDRVALTDFVLPGSHNSAAIDMHTTSCAESSSGQNWVLDLSLNHNRVAKNQEISLQSQMLEGIRLFDIRVIDGVVYTNAVKSSWRHYPLHHSFLIDDPVDTMEDAMNELCNFVHQNPGEFIVARIRARTADYCEFGTRAKGGWLSALTSYRNMGTCAGKVVTFEHWHLTYPLSLLQGKVFVDIQNAECGDHMCEHYTSDTGVVGYDGDPFEVARSLRNKGFPQEIGKFKYLELLSRPIRK